MREDFGKTNIVCLHNGSMSWIAPVLFKAFCRMDVLNWPFDTQTCELKFGSWTYDGSKIDLKLRDAVIEADGVSAVFMIRDESPYGY